MEPLVNRNFNCYSIYIFQSSKTFCSKKSHVVPSTYKCIGCAAIKKILKMIFDEQEDHA